MDQLFIQVGNAKEPISEEMVNKYHLKKGMKSPFTGSKIVDKYGDSHLEQEDKARFRDVEENGIIYTTSEILG